MKTKSRNFSSRLFFLSTTSSNSSLFIKMSCFSGFFGSKSIESIRNPFDDPPTPQHQYEQEKLPLQSESQKPISSSKKIALLRSQLLLYNLDA